MGNLGRRLFAFKPISRELFGARRTERKTKRSKDRVVNSQGQGGWFDSHPLKGYCQCLPGPDSKAYEVWYLGGCMYGGMFPSSNIAQYMPPGAFQELFIAGIRRDKTLRTEASGGQNEEQTRVV